jgi:hypothetical protein
VNPRVRGYAVNVRWSVGVFVLALCACSPTAPRAPTQAAAPAVSTTSRQPRAPRLAVARDAVPAAPAAVVHLDDVARVTDTFDSLRQRYGEANVRRETLPGGEGTEVAGWVLFPDNPQRRIEVYPDEAGRHPGLLLVREKSGWTRSDGLRLGLDTRALEAMNGRAFQFVGFDWDYGGVIDDWKGGNLAQGGHFIGPVQLCPPSDVPEDYPAGDAEFMSDLPAVRAHPATVCEFGVAFDAAKHDSPTRDVD